MDSESGGEGTRAGGHTFNYYFLIKRLRTFHFTQYETFYKPNLKSNVDIVCELVSSIDSGSVFCLLLQIVGPADGSNYIVDYYGTRLTRLSITNQTYRKPHLSL